MILRDALMHVGYILYLIFLVACFVGMVAALTYFVFGPPSIIVTNITVITNTTTTISHIVTGG